MEELHYMHKHIPNIIVTEHDSVLNINHLCSLPSAKSILTGFGRPWLRVSAGEINWLYDVFRVWKEVSLDLGVSVRMLERRQNILNIWQNWKLQYIHNHFGWTTKFCCEGSLGNFTRCCWDLHYCSMSSN